MGAIYRRPVQTYRTNFLGATENPISEGGNYTNGLAVGIDWKDMQATASGKCYGTQPGGNRGSSGPPYDDSTAIYIGNYGAEQEVISTVYSLNPTTLDFEEVEHRLRSVVTAHVNRGYEMSWAARDSGNAPYAGIVRWNGALNDFTVLINAVNPPGLTTGCQIRSTAFGTHLAMYQRNPGVIPWTLVCDYDCATGTGTGSGASGVMDSVIWRDGNPGPGHWLRGNNPGSDYGFTDFDVRCY